MDSAMVGGRLRGLVVGLLSAALAACGGDDQPTTTPSGAGNAIPAEQGGQVAVTPAASPGAAVAEPVAGAGGGGPPDSRPPGRAGAPGAAYSFTPHASDPQGDHLTFSVENLPAWASFNTRTGRLSGRPGLEHVGTASAIVISVHDGGATASLAAFDLTVQAFGAGSATLAWTPPTTNTDGSPLMNLSGYKVYWGTASGDYPNSVTLTNPGLTSYVVDNLAPATYFFVMTSVSAPGIESAVSRPATKTIH
jgi:hypothetical protein